MPTSRLPFDRENSHKQSKNRKPELYKKTQPSAITNVTGNWQAFNYYFTQTNSRLDVSDFLSKNRIFPLYKNTGRVYTTGRFSSEGI